MTTIAIISVAVIAFAVGFAAGTYFGIYGTAKAIVDGKVDNVKVTR